MSSGLFDNKRPLYQIVAEKLIEGIEDGDYPVGELLPSEAQLCEKHGVSRHTVRAAIRELSDRGMLYAQPGIGTRVMSRRLGGYAQTMKEISDLNEYVTETKREVLKRESVRAEDAEIGLPGDEDGIWCMFEAVRHVTGTDTVVAWTQVFVLPEYSDVIKDVPDNSLVYSLIESRYHIRTVSLRQSIKAVGCPESAALHLGLEPGSPALSIRREYKSQDGKVFEVSWSIHPPERFESKMELALSLNPG